MNTEARKAIYVEWVDSATSPGWKEVDCGGPITIKSIGWLIHDDPRFIVIASSESSSDRILDQLSIPRDCIVKIRKVRQ